MTQFALTRLPAPPVARQIGAAVHRTPLLSAEGLMERMFSRLFHGLVYPQIWEDPAVDMAALDIRPGDRLVAIASGGCNVLSYLTQGPGSILAVDLSPAHVALGRLKLAAARTLPDHAAFFDLFGRADLPGNAALYDRHIAPALDGRSRRYWEARSPFGRRIQLFERGFYRHGALGRFIGAAHTLARAAGTDLRGFLDCPDIEAQRSFFYAHIGPLFEAPVVQALARRPAALFGLGIPPAQYALLAGDGDGDVLPVLRQRLHRLLCDFPLRENYFAFQAIARRYPRPGEGALPPYLEPTAFETLRENAGRVQIENRSLTEALAAEPEESIHGFTLLDAQDWMTDAQLTALWRQVTRTAAPGARVIFRTGGAADLLPGRVPEEILGHWRADRAAGQAGHAADRSAIYGGFHLYRRRDA
ncbi:DUF3419 family protein [Cereibacter sphaeroides]|uniref:DUF3419 family protein n=1 Tax=Cereibacter sphaeroides TaxID=1063 RepID=UPI00399044E8